ncbi:acyltransferase [Streptomyces sp. PT12]|uniref:acyltransferase family protein n=1 Tax=Streptomyces sp. PT12 TaxID=1510197 RepID=UPI000DE3EA9C|nr:acyltransferase [Streptomyces sp. PT12]RBM06244.1 acyltransferase [Streptomyces sp. PT12]
MSTAPTDAPSASARPRLASITGLRFLAALAVFLFHIAIFRPFSHTGVSDALFTAFSKAGWAGVSFFFLLSGYVLTWAARPGDPVTAFWRRRLLKLFPNHLVTYALTMALYAIASVSLGTALLNLVLLQPWATGEPVFFSVNNPSWSLGCELFFYLMFPLLHRWIAAVPAGRLWWWAAGLMGAIIALPAVAYAAVPGEPSMMAPDTPVPALGFWLVYIFPITRLLDFTLGIVMARVVLEGRWPRLPLAPVLALLLACYALSLHLPGLYALTATSVVPFALLIPAVATLDVRGRHTVLRGRTMTWLGEVSFAFYLVHWPVLNYGQRLLGEGRQYSLPMGTALVALCFAVSLLLAWLLYIGVERPAMRRWSGRRPRAMAPETARRPTGPPPVPALPTDLRP